MDHDAIAVIDFGGQYAHLIATKVRRQGVFAEIRQPEDPIEVFAPYRGIIISGSPSLASHGEDSAYTKAIYDLDVPILGFCFGHQEIAKHYGGEVVHGGREWGKADLHLTPDHGLFKGLDAVQSVWMSHYDSVVKVGPEFKELGYSVTADGAPDHRFAAIGSDTLKRYGFQFHPEVDDTAHGDDMIANFVLDICGCRPTWSMDGFLAEEVARIQAHVGDGSVFLLASGGVDSTVAAVMIAHALGPDRLRLLHPGDGVSARSAAQRTGPAEPTSDASAAGWASEAAPENQGPSCPRSPDPAPRAGLWARDQKAPRRSRRAAADAASASPTAPHSARTGRECDAPAVPSLSPVRPE